MSDDQTKLLDNEPPTTLPTQPMMEAVLERINLVGMQIMELRTELEEFRKEQKQAAADLRTEMQAGFRKLDRRLDVLTGEVIDLKEKQREIERRLDEPENKPS